MKKAMLLAALATLSFTASANNFSIATGSEGGGYERLGKKVAVSIKKAALRKNVAVGFQVLNTNGSIENIELFDSGEAQVAIVQADALNIKKPTSSFKAKTAGTEVVWWLYNLKNGYTDIEDIEGKKDLRMVIIDESGASVTMQSFASEDSGYEINVNTAIHADDIYDAADIACEGKIDGKKVAGFLYVGKQIPAEIVNDFKSCIGVGEATDGDFNDAKDVNGEYLYTNCKISKNQLQGMKGGSWGSQSTVCVKSMIIYSDGFDNSNLNRAFKKGINKAIRKS